MVESEAIFPIQQLNINFLRNSSKPENIQEKLSRLAHSRVMLLRPEFQSQTDWAQMLCAIY